MYVFFLNCTLCQRFCGGSCCLWSWIHSWRPWEQTYRKKARISLSGSNKDDDDLHKRKWSVTDSPSFQHTKTIRFIDKSTTKLLLSYYYRNGTIYLFSNRKKLSLNCITVVMVFQMKIMRDSEYFLLSHQRSLMISFW